MKNPAVPRRALYTSSGALADPRHHHHLTLAVVLFDISRHARGVDGHELTRTEAVELYTRWFGMPHGELPDFHTRCHRDAIQPNQSHF